MFKTVKNEETFKKLLSLCYLNEENNLYYSKIDKEYVESFKSYISGKNQNDIPFTIEDIKEQPTLDDFSFKGLDDFEYVCKLYAKPMIIKKDEQKKENEKIFVVNDSFVNEKSKKLFFNTLGVVYIITCNLNGFEHIIKIGQSRNTFASRLDSYNCGSVTNIRTASTTNIKILQSFVATRKHFNLYICDCSDENKSFEWCGLKSPVIASSKCCAYENILVTAFMNQFNFKPLANVQSNLLNLKDD